MFSFALAPYNEWSRQSVFTLGGYDLDTYAANQTITWNDVIGTDYWTVTLTGARVGNSTITVQSKFAMVFIPGKKESYFCSMIPFSMKAGIEEIRLE